jgi:hypothetical protein
MTMIGERAQNLWIWMIGTLVVTLTWTIALFNTGFGMFVLMLFPFLSFYAFKRTTSIFDITDEEKERMRQDAITHILKNINNAYKTLWKMGYINDLTDMSYQKDEWTKHERATLEVAFELISENLRRRKAQKPLKHLQPEEIKYLVQQKRKEKELDTFRMLKEEVNKRQEELAMLHELMEAEKDDEPEADGIITDVEADIMEIKEIENELEAMDEDIEEETEVDEDEDDKELKSLEEEVAAIDEEIEEVENDEDYEEEETGFSPVIKVEKEPETISIKPVEGAPFISQEPLLKVLIDEEHEPSQSTPEPVTVNVSSEESDKKSLRDVLSAAMIKLKEVEEDEQEE